MMKKENMKLKIQILACMFSAFFAINPLLLLLFGKKENTYCNTTIGTTNHTTSEKKTYFELIDELSSNPEISFEDLVLPTTNDSCTYINNTNTDDNLYERTVEQINCIKKNSIDYITNNKEYTLGFIDDIDNEHNQDKLMVQSIFKDAISDILINSTSKDLCVLKDLKVVIRYSIENNNCLEYKKEDNLIIIYPNNNWEDIEYAIRLELNKIRIDNCNCQDNTLFTYNTLNNAAVVSELYNTSKTDIFTSSDDIKNETLFLTLGLFHDNYTIDNYYKAIFNNDIDALYRFCNANSDEDIYKLNKILYAMNNNIDPQDYDYKTELFGIIINNLINYTNNNKNFNLKNNLIIFNALKNLFNNNSSKNIEALCNTYINYLSNHYMENINTITNMLNDEEITDYTIALYNLCNKFEKSGTVNSFDLTYSNKLLSKFPLLRQILILSIYQDYNNNLSKAFILSKTRNS